MITCAAIEKSNTLLAMEPDELRRNAPEVRYVFANGFEQNRLSASLLLDETFPGFEKIAEFQNENGRPMARAFRVGHPEH